jgi:hypothetical protein
MTGNLCLSSLTIEASAVLRSAGSLEPFFHITSVFSCMNSSKCKIVSISDAPLGAAGNKPPAFSESVLPSGRLQFETLSGHSALTLTTT